MSADYEAAAAGTSSTPRTQPRQKPQPFPRAGGADRPEAQLSVHDATYNLLRRLGMTTIFGNLGSTEQTFLKNFPDDFEYVLGLQEASVIAMADGFAQATRKPVFVNLHSCAGPGNGMGNIIGAFQNKTPLIITAGQQTREMALSEPYLTNVDETMLPRPWVKWSYQPIRAQDVPAALLRAYLTAIQPPAGPVYVVIPFDDWDQPALGDEKMRTTSTRYAPDPERIAAFAERIRRSKNPLLVYGPEIDRSGGWEAGIRFAEQLQAPVYLSPLPDRISFPLTHPQFRGALPIAIGPLSKRVEGYDLVIVIGSEVFRYYPYVSGDYLPQGTELLHITGDPLYANKAVAGDSLLSDAKLALDSLIQLVPKVQGRTLPPAAKPATMPPSPSGGPLRAIEAFTALSELRPKNAIVVDECPSSAEDILRTWPITDPQSYFSFAHGGLGWGAPAAVGVAMAEMKTGSGRPVIAFMGDGALQYSVQCLYTAVQHKAKVIFIVPCNGEYAILKEFAVLEETPNVPGLELPGFDFVSTAKGYGMRAVEAKTREEIKQAFGDALKVDGPSLIAIPVAREPNRPLIAP